MIVAQNFAITSSTGLDSRHPWVSMHSSDLVLGQFKSDLENGNQANRNQQ